MLQKILFKLLAGIALIVALMCGLIVLSSYVPAVSDILKQGSDTAVQKIEQVKAEKEALAALAEAEAAAAAEEAASVVEEVTSSSTDSSSEDVSYELYITEDGQYTVVPAGSTTASSETSEDESTEGSSGSSTIPLTASAATGSTVEIVENIENAISTAINSVNKKSYDEYASSETWNPEGINEEAVISNPSNENAYNSEIQVPNRNDYLPTEYDTNEIAEEDESLLSEYTTGDLGNDLTFDELYYPYYNMLDEAAQAVYRQLYANTLQYNQKIRLVTPASSMQVQNAFLAMIYDHPELFWLDTQMYTQSTQDGLVLAVDTVYYTFTNDLDTEIQNFESAAQSLISSLDGSEADYEKELTVHDILANKLTYNISAAYNQSPYSAIVNSDTVCAGYSRAFQYLMQKLEVPTYTCVGWAGGTSGGMHGWNIIKLDEDYYNVDLTWDDADPTIYTYLNCSDEDFNEDHSRMWLSIYLPPCNGSIYSDLKLNSLEDYGLTSSDVIASMQDYYNACAAKTNTALDNDATTFDFTVVISEDIYNEWKLSYGNGDYYSGYLTNIALERNATLAIIECEDTKLSDG
ncbi:MAG: hypothetical protein K6B41_07090, partial [Butyrivibrio sp.]|nr:hypothetical protein [Butyrivibrio sp.]